MKIDCTFKVLTATVPDQWTSYKGVLIGFLDSSLDLCGVVVVADGTLRLIRVDYIRITGAALEGTHLAVKIIAEPQADGVLPD